MKWLKWLAVLAPLLSACNGGGDGGGSATIIDSGSSSEKVVRSFTAEIQSPFAWEKAHLFQITGSDAVAVADGAPGQALTVRRVIDPDALPDPSAFYVVLTGVSVPGGEVSDAVLVCAAGRTDWSSSVSVVTVCDAGTTALYAVAVSRGGAVDPRLGIPESDYDAFEDAMASSLVDGPTTQVAAVLANVYALLVRDGALLLRTAGIDPLAVIVNGAAVAMGTLSRDGAITTGEILDVMQRQIGQALDLDAIAMESDDLYPLLAAGLPGITSPRNHDIAQRGNLILLNPAPPDAPVRVDAVPTSDGAVLTWPPVPQAERYRIYVDLVLVDETTVPRYTLTGLEPGFTYTVGVSSVNFYGESPPTEINVSPIALPVVAAFTGRFEEGTGVVLTWSLANPDDVGGSVVYTLYRENQVIFMGEATTFTDTDVVQASEAYTVTYRLVPHGVAGDGPEATTTVKVPPVTVEAEPPRIGSFEGHYDSGQEAVVLTWSLANPDRVGSEPVSYRLERDGTPIFVGFATSYKDVGAGPGDHIYTLTPTGEAGTGEPVSITVTVPGNAPGPIEPPRIASFEGHYDPATGGVVLTWSLANPDDVGSEPVSYQLERDDMPVFFGTDTTVTDFPLPGTHTYDLTPIGEAGAGDTVSIVVTVP